ncbi:MAG: LysM peptidoglycan-binding domain-containing protein [Acidimicrobiia bacterium]
MRKRLPLGVVIVALIAAVVVLHRLADYYPLAGLQTGPLELALGAIARLVGLTIAYWLLGSAVLLILVHLTAFPAAIRAISWVTWRPLRRLIERSVASTLVIALSTSSASTSVAPGYVPVPAGDPTTTTSHTATTQPLSITVLRPVDTLYLPIENPRQTAVATTVGEIEVTVQRGDSMWLLAERRLRELRDHNVTDADIAPYWLAVIAANTGRIRSGDPDLIFPGELLLLPEWGSEEAND